MAAQPSRQPSERSIRASIAARESWARTTDRSARTAAARDAQRRRYLDRARELQGPAATDQQVADAADQLFRADQARRSLAAVKARQAKAAARRQAEAADPQPDEVV